MAALLNLKEIIHSYTLIPLKNPVDPKNIIIRIMTMKISPKMTMAGRRTAKTAFPIEIPCPSLTPRMNKIII
jgi:hypothetical protein